jgi:hypothetical protein
LQQTLVGTDLFCGKYQPGLCPSRLDVRIRGFSGNGNAGSKVLGIGRFGLLCGRLATVSEPTKQVDFPAGANTEIEVTLVAIKCRRRAGKASRGLSKDCRRKVDCAASAPEGSSRALAPFAAARACSTRASAAARSRFWSIAR